MAIKFQLELVSGNINKAKLTSINYIEINLKFQILDDRYLWKLKYLLDRRIEVLSTHIK